ncbi:MAG: SGNH/GDSL hydrolase family protein [Desulfovibrio sp.]
MAVRGGRRWLFVLCVVLVNVALFVLLEWGAGLILAHLEGGERQTRIFNAENGRDAGFVVQYDERLGYRLVRHDADPSRFEDSAGKTVPVAKAPGVYRILCLGGSTTYGVGADKTNSFPAQLEDLLTRVYGGCKVRFEVLNLGVMGYHSWHSRIRFRSELAKLKPDLVIAMDAVNDLAASTLADDSAAFAKEKDKLLSLANAGRQGGFLERADRYLDTHVSLYALVKRFAAKIGSAAGQGKKADAPAVFRKKIELFGYRDNMKALAGLVRKDGGEFVLVDYPWLAMDPLPGNAPKVVHDASTPLYRFGKTYFPEANAAVARQEGAFVLNPQPDFDAAVAADVARAGQYYFDEIHLTKLGNQLLARDIAAGLPNVPSFARAVAGCSPADPEAALANAVKLDDPRVDFRNGWPRPGETAVPLAVAATANVVIGQSDEYPGHAVAQCLDPARPGSITLRAGAAFAPRPMAHTRYPAFWYPRLACAADRVEVEAAGRTIFTLAGTTPCRFTDASARFGLDLPALTAGDTVTVRLFGHAQLWLTNGNPVFTGDVTPPGY